MNYTFESWTIKDLLTLYEENKLNLNPSYQRNDIWSLPAKKKLIDSIEIGYPLPAFFLHKKENGQYDIVDGQQRTRTFLGYRKKLFPDKDKKYFDSEKEDLFNNYKISVALLVTENDDDGMIEDFYYRVNNFGVKLNRPETKKAQFANTKLQILIEELADDHNFASLNLFTQKAVDRLADLDFISELLSLLYIGITDKKIAADKLYENQDIPDEEFVRLKNQFLLIISRISELNQIYPIHKTRYKQKNDFYTLFSFLEKHFSDISDEHLVYAYKILVLIGEDIYPTNDKCWVFQEYANNCVSQSNSKRAREERLSFFEKILLNEQQSGINEHEFEEIFDVLNFYNLDESTLFELNNYYLIDINRLMKIKPDIKFSDGI